MIKNGVLFWKEDGGMYDEEIKLLLEFILRSHEHRHACLSMAVVSQTLLTCRDVIT